MILSPSTLRATARVILVIHLTSLTAWANPRGGSVVSGSASIAESGAVMTINQASGKAIINWQGFSNSAGETVRFVQPASTSATLNRVTGSESSVINGAMQANGRVFLINPNGVVFGKTATVNTGGLVASTLEMTDGDFNAGRHRLTQHPGKPLRAVVNQGSIQTAPGGRVALVAPMVNNEGTIDAPGGQVALAAGTSAVVTLDGEGLVSVAVREAPAGNVILAPSAVSPLLAQAVNNRHIVEAGSVRTTASGEVELGAAEGIAMNQGTIRVDAEAGQQAGRIQVHGTQLAALTEGSLTSARGGAAGSRGGTIHVTSQNRVGVFQNAVVTASGRAGGGTVKIGGPRENQRDVGLAKATYVAAGARVSADAEDEGDGGTVIARADQSLRVDGALTARGAGRSGSGGFIETSAGHVAVNTTPDASAPAGAAGTWLIDPIDIEIVAGSAQTDVDATAAGFEPSGTGTPAQIGVTDIDDALALGNVVIRTNNAGNSGTDLGSITWMAGASLDYDGIPTGRSLTLEAQNKIEFSGTIADSTPGDGNKLDVVFRGASGGAVADFITIRSGALINTGGTTTADLGSFTARAAGDFRVEAGAQVIARQGTDVSGTIEASRVVLAVDSASRVVDLAITGGGSVQNNVAGATSGLSTNAALPNLTFKANSGTLTVGANDTTGISQAQSLALESDGALKISEAISTLDLQLLANGTLAVEAPVSTSLLLMRLGGAATSTAPGRIDTQFAQFTLKTADAISLNVNGNHVENNSASAGSGFSFGPMSSSASKLNFVLSSGALPLRIGTNTTAGIDDAGASISLQSADSTTIDAAIAVSFVEVSASGTGTINVNAVITADTVKFTNPASTFLTTTLGGSGSITAPNVAIDLLDPNAAVSLSVNGGALRGNIDGVGSGFSFTGATPTALTLTAIGLGSTLAVGSNLGESGINNPGGSLKMDAAGSLSSMAPIQVKDVELRAGRRVNVGGSITADTVLLHVDSGSSELFPGGPVVPNSINASGAVFTPDLTVDVGDAANLAYVNAGLGLNFNQQSPTSGLSFTNAPAGNAFFVENVTFRVQSGTLRVGDNFSILGVATAGFIGLEAVSGTVLVDTPVVAATAKFVTDGTVQLNNGVTATTVAHFEATNVTSSAPGTIDAGLMQFVVPRTGTVDVNVAGAMGNDSLTYDSMSGLLFAGTAAKSLQFTVSDGLLKVASVSTGGAVTLTSGLPLLGTGGDIDIAGAVSGQTVSLTALRSGANVFARGGLSATAGDVSILADGAFDTDSASVTATGDVLIAAGGGVATGALQAGGKIAIGAAQSNAVDSIDVSGTVAAGGDFAASADGSISIEDVATAGGEINLEALSGGITYHQLVSTGTNIAMGGTGNITVRADSGDVTMASLGMTAGQVKAASGDVSLRALDGSVVALSGGVESTAGTVEIFASNEVTGKTISGATVQLTSSGRVNLNGQVTGTSSVTIRADNSILSDNGLVTGGEVTLASARDIRDITASGELVGVQATGTLRVEQTDGFAATRVRVNNTTDVSRLEVFTNDINGADLMVSTNGGLLKTDSGAVSAGGFTTPVTVQYENAASDYVVDGIDLRAGATSGSLELKAGASRMVTQTGAIVTNGLALDGGSYTLDHANNEIAVLGGIVDDVTLVSNGDLALGDTGRFTGVGLRATTAIVLTTDGSITGTNTGLALDAPDVTLTAASIGSAMDPLRIDAGASTLNATTTTGGLHVQDPDELGLGNLQVAGDMVLGAGGPLSVRNVMVTGRATLRSGGDISLLTGGVGLRAHDAVLEATGTIGSAATAFLLDIGDLELSAGAAEAGVAANLQGTVTGARALGTAGIPANTIVKLNGAQIIPALFVAPPTPDPVAPIVPVTPTLPADPVAPRPGTGVSTTMVFADSSLRGADPSVSLRTAGTSGGGTTSAPAEQSNPVDVSGADPGDAGADGDLWVDDTEDASSGKKKAKAKLAAAR